MGRGRRDDDFWRTHAHGAQSFRPHADRKPDCSCRHLGGIRGIGKELSAGKTTTRYSIPAFVLRTSLCGGYGYCPDPQSRYAATRRVSARRPHGPAKKCGRQYGVFPRRSVSRRITPLFPPIVCAQRAFGTAFPASCRDRNGRMEIFSYAARRHLHNLAHAPMDRETFRGVFSASFYRVLLAFFNQVPAQYTQARTPARQLSQFAARLIVALGKYGVVCLLLLWLVIDTIIASPHFLSYYNELAGGSRNGWKIAVDSNYDWGQDLKRLADFMDQNNIGKISLEYFES